MDLENIADSEGERAISTDSEAWRGDVHLADWPWEFAGPEYKMYKSVVDAIEDLCV